MKLLICSALLIAGVFGDYFPLKPRIYATQEEFLHGAPPVEEIFKPYSKPQNEVGSNSQQNSVNGNGQLGGLNGNNGKFDISKLQNDIISNSINGLVDNKLIAQMIESLKNKFPSKNNNLGATSSQEGNPQVIVQNIHLHTCCNESEGNEISEEVFNLGQTAYRNKQNSKLAFRSTLQSDEFLQDVAKLDEYLSNPAIDVSDKINQMPSRRGLFKSLKKVLHKLHDMVFEPHSHTVHKNPVPVRVPTTTAKPSLALPRSLSLNGDSQNKKDLHNLFDKLNSGLHTLQEASSAENNEEVDQIVADSRLKELVKQLVQETQAKVQKAYELITELTTLPQNDPRREEILKELQELVSEPLDLFPNDDAALIEYHVKLLDRIKKIKNVPVIRSTFHQIAAVLIKRMLLMAQNGVAAANSITENGVQPRFMWGSVLNLAGNILRPVMKNLKISVGTKDNFLNFLF